MFDQQEFPSDNSNAGYNNPNKPNQSILEDENQTSDDVNHQKNKLSIGSLFLLILILVSTGLGVYFQLRVNNLNQEIQATQTAIQAQAQNIVSSDNQEVGLQVKNAFLNLKNTERTFFKNILQNLSQDISSNSRFRIQSYTINSQGQVSLNISSTQNSINPIQDTANLIQTLKQRTYFSNIFVPGITQALTENGLSQIQFNLQLNHNLDQSNSNTINNTQTQPIPNPNPDPQPEPTPSPPNENLRPVTPSLITE